MGVRSKNRFAFPDLVRAFQDGERFGDGVTKVVDAGELVVPSGKIVACDPGYLLVSHIHEQASRVPCRRADTPSKSLFCVAAVGKRTPISKGSLARKRRSKMCP
jgi:hypothetical protein